MANKTRSNLQPPHFSGYLAGDELTRACSAPFQPQPEPPTPACPGSVGFPLAGLARRSQSCALLCSGKPTSLVSSRGLDVHLISRRLRSRRHLSPWSWAAEPTRRSNAPAAPVLHLAAGDRGCTAGHHRHRRCHSLRDAPNSSPQPNTRRPPPPTFSVAMMLARKLQRHQPFFSIFSVVLISQPGARKTRLLPPASCLSRARKGALPRV